MSARAAARRAGRTGSLEQVRLLTWERRNPRADVLVVTNMWPHEGNPGYGIFVRRQVDSLVEAGIACDVLFVRGHRSPLAYALAALRLGVWNLRPPRRYRLLHGHGGETALAIRCFLRAPVLVSYCGDDLLGTPGADGVVRTGSRLRRAVQRGHARSLSASITKSEEMQQALPGSIRARNHVIPNGVDTAVFAPVSREDARRALGWDLDQPVALFAADPAVERKRHWLAAAACEAAAARLPGLRLHVAANVSPDQMPMLMSAADCLLLTSAIEGSPNVVKEALMCDLPVVATDCGDVRQLLASVEPSSVCVDDPAALADGLVACMEPRRRSNGRAVSSWLTQEAVAARVIALYEQLAPGVMRAAEHDRSCAA